MKWFFRLAVALLLVSISFTATSEWIVFPELAALFIIMGLAFYASELPGRYTTVGELRRREIYVVHGKGEFVADGTKRQVFFVRRDNDPVVCVELPIDLPDRTGSFVVIQDFDGWGCKLKGIGAIVVSLPDCSKKISFPWKPKSK